MEVCKKKQERCCLCKKTKNLTNRKTEWEKASAGSCDERSVTICDRCNRMADRLKENTHKEYNELLFAIKNAENQSGVKNAYCALESKIKRTIVDELWLRDLSFGGDLKILNDNDNLVASMTKVVKIVYPDVKGLNITKPVKRKMRGAGNVLGKYAFVK